MGVKGKACDSSAVTAFHIAFRRNTYSTGYSGCPLPSSYSRYSLLLMASQFYFSPTVALEATCKRCRKYLCLTVASISRCCHYEFSVLMFGATRSSSVQIKKLIVFWVSFLSSGRSPSTQLSLVPCSRTVYKPSQGQLPDLKELHCVTLAPKVRFEPSNR